jgi:hypothetical protein
MDPMQQFFQNQMQLLENLTNTVANLHAQVSNPPQPPPQQPVPMNKHKEFMSHSPPVFTHVADPLDADDWLKTVLTVQKRAQVHRKPTGDLVPFSPRRVLPRFVNPRIGSKLLGFSI